MMTAYALDNRKVSWKFGFGFQLYTDGGIWRDLSLAGT